jgi:integrase
LRRLIRSGDTGEHVAPDKIMLAQWVEQWIAAGAPGRRQKRVGRRTLERYDELLRCHVVPTLGARPLQQIQASEIDGLYTRLEQSGDLSPRTLHHVHTVLGASLNTAVREGLLVASPIERAEKVPSAGEADHGIALDEEQLRIVLDGFKGSVLFPMMAVAAFAGARRNEILGLRHNDLNVAEKTLRIERAVEKTRKHGLALKEPKRARHKRTITIDDDLIALLLAEREKHARILAAIGDQQKDDHLVLDTMGDDTYNVRGVDFESAFQWGEADGGLVQAPGVPPSMASNIDKAQVGATVAAIEGMTDEQIREVVSGSRLVLAEKTRITDGLIGRRGKVRERMKAMGWLD